MFNPFRVVFHLDGAGVYYDPAEPIMLDGLLCACNSRFHVHGEAPMRDEEPLDVPLPLRKWEAGGTWGWHASALLPDGDTLESVQFYRKRFRQGKVDFTTGSPNLTNGPYRDWNQPLPLLHCLRMVAYGYGDRYEVQRALRRGIRYLGKKRAHGKGAVTEINVETIAQDYSFVRDGVAIKWMPAEGGTRVVRPRPPYWSNHGRVECCEIGEARR